MAERVAQYGAAVRRRLAPEFQRGQVPYPPAALVLVALKQEKRLEVHASDGKGAFRPVRAYPILAASGHAGPKFREGDFQVPEGLYQIEELNPNSLYHLSLRISYPNAFDRQQAQAEHRTDLGGDIMIHGNAHSSGCLAMGDPASEDLFVLAALTGYKNIQVIMAPSDFRLHAPPPPAPSDPAWLAPLYDAVQQALLPHPVIPLDAPAEPR